MIAPVTNLGYWGDKKIKINQCLMLFLKESAISIQYPFLTINVFVCEFPVYSECPTFRPSLFVMLPVLAVFKWGTQ